MTSTFQPLTHVERAPKRSGFFRSRSSLFRRVSNPDLSNLARRDSALGSPENTSQSSSFPELREASNSADTALSVPAIVVRDEGRNTQTINPPALINVLEHVPNNSLPGFRGITLRIPTGQMEDPFASESMQFSNRGSVMVRNGNATVSRRSVSEASKLEAVAETHALEQAEEMTADDRRSSQKVRSMYELGLDDTPWAPDQSDLGTERTIRVIQEDESESSTPLVQHDLLSHMTSARSDEGALKRGKESVEPAGGIEDWQGVNAEEVDRYGFVNKTSKLSPTPQGRPNNRPLSTLMVSRSRPSPGEAGSNQLTVNDAKGSRMSSANSQHPSIRSGGGTRSTSVLSFFSLRSDESRRRKTIRHASDMLGPIQTTQVEDLVEPSRAALERRREVKWTKMARPINTKTGDNGGGTTFTFDTASPKLISRTWKGIPDRWRASAWHSFLLASAKRQLGVNFPTDAQLTQRFTHLQTLDCVDDLQIDTDVPRTIGGHIMFRRRYRGGQRFLFRVLRALALHFPATGYVQGMAPLVATLLCYYDEEQAFVMAARLWQLRGLTTLYSPGFGGLMDALGVFESKWLGAKDGGKLARYLDTLGIMPMAYGTKWYLTLFNYSVPFAAQLRVWDVFILLGDSTSSVSQRDNLGTPDLNVLHATALALVDGMYDRLVHAEFEDAMGLLTAAVPVGSGREDVLMGVVRAEWEAARKRAPGKHV